MFIVKVKEVLEESAKARPKPIIKVLPSVKKSHPGKVAQPDDIEPEQIHFSNPSKSELLADLTKEARDIHIERAKLSNKYHELESAGASQELFRENYHAIEALTDEMKVLFNKKRYLERYGQLPVEPSQPEPSSESDNIYELKEKRRSLNNRKHKAKKKLDQVAKYPPGSPRHTEIMLELDQIEAEQDQVNRRIKRLEAELS